MVITRNAGDAAAPHSRRRNSSRSSPTRSSGRLQRLTKTSYLEISDDSATSDEEIDSDPASDAADTDSDNDSGIDFNPDASSSRKRKRTVTAVTASTDAPSRRRTPRRNSRRVTANTATATAMGSNNSPRKKRSRRSIVKRSSPRPKKSYLSPSKKRHRPSPNKEPQQSSGIIPDWLDPRIPFDCWADIFYYAGCEDSSGTLASNWLILAATTCKLFAEPALSTLYRSPPLRHANKAKRLAALLERPPSETRINYRTKIESLHVEIHVVPPTVLYQLIQPLPRLRELIFYTTADHPPYRDLDKNARWQYPEDAFRALQAAPAASDDIPSEKPFPAFLKSWEWSGTLMGGCVPTVADIAQVHQTPSFSQLTRLSFTNFQVPSLRRLLQKANDEEAELQAYHEDGAVIRAIGDAISHLKSLRHLVFESSTVMNERLLPLLPKTLVHLELINCWEIRSEDLAPFLHSHGASLRTLSLLHCQSLDLAYLTDLAEACPNLRELHMNLSYFRHHDCVNDSDPMYDQALLPGQTPTWPRTIRVINIEHVRGWSVEAAEMFLKSLIDNAANLPDLRYLAIKTMLDIPWQARASFRLQWRETMERVFLRPFESPMHRTTLQPSDKTRDAAAVASPSLKRKRLSSESQSSRRSGRIAANDDMPAGTSHEERKTRHNHGRPLYREPDTDEEEFDIPDAGDDDESVTEDLVSISPSEKDSGAEPVIQGRCNVVNILFDNQKVRELQYSMEDFQSESEESEDEWNGDDDEDESVVVFQ